MQNPPSRGRPRLLDAAAAAASTAASKKKWRAANERALRAIKTLDRIIARRGALAAAEQLFADAIPATATLASADAKIAQLVHQRLTFLPAAKVTSIAQKVRREMKRQPSALAGLAASYKIIAAEADRRGLAVPARPGPQRCRLPTPPPPSDVDRLAEARWQLRVASGRHRERMLLAESFLLRRLAKNGQISAAICCNFAAEHGRPPQGTADESI